MVKKLLTRVAVRITPTIVMRTLGADKLFPGARIYLSHRNAKTDGEVAAAILSSLTRNFPKETFRCSQDLRDLAGMDNYAKERFLEDYVGQADILVILIGEGWESNLLQSKYPGKDDKLIKEEMYKAYKTKQPKRSVIRVTIDDIDIKTQPNAPTDQWIQMFRDASIERFKINSSDNLRRDTSVLIDIIWKRLAKLYMRNISMALGVFILTILICPFLTQWLPAFLPPTQNVYIEGSSSGNTPLPVIDVFRLTPTVAPPPTLPLHLIWIPEQPLLTFNHDQTWLRSDPNSSTWPVIEALKNGVKVNVDDPGKYEFKYQSPYYDGTQWWWFVRAESGNVGWVEEYQLKECPDRCN